MVRPAVTCNNLVKTSSAKRACNSGIGEGALCLLARLSK